MDKIDIKLFHTPILNCIENIQTSVVSWKGYHHELLFSESWGFAFDSKCTDEKILLGKRIDRNERSMLELFKEHYGMEINFHSEKNENMLSSIRAVLETGNPVVIGMDVFWEPWGEFYQEFHHYPNARLVVGIDEKNEVLNYYAIINSKEELQLSFENFGNGCGMYGTFDFSGKKKDLDWKKEVRKSLSRLEGNMDTESAFDSMRHFADVLENELDIVKEIEGYNTHTWVAPIMLNTTWVANGRYKFAEFLKYITEHFQADELLDFSTLLIQAGDTWNTINDILTKLMFVPGNRSLMSKIASRIKEVADFEENIATKMKGII
ncbi:MAG: BtrH N-terminal domain-containing protein [Clostridia bacterium]|nr:BtrH N-terminal domain-containing protein [Clostridia bacterium]